MNNAKIDWDKVREIMDEFAGSRPRIGAITTRLDEEGILDESTWAFKCELARKIIQRLNKEARSEGRRDEQFFNFEKNTEDGKVQYYEQQKKATRDEWVGLTHVEARKTNKQINKLYEIFDYGCEKWGRKYQQHIKFPMPERPLQAETV